MVTRIGMTHRDGAEGDSVKKKNTPTNARVSTHSGMLQSFLCGRGSEEHHR